MFNLRTNGRITTSAITKYGICIITRMTMNLNQFRPS